MRTDAVVVAPPVLAAIDVDDFDNFDEGYDRDNSAQLFLSIAVVGTIVLCVLPLASVDLTGRPTFVSAGLALVASLDLLSVVFLVRQFRDTGNRRALILGSAFALSVPLLGGFGLTFRGVLTDAAALGGWPTTAPCLWVAWHISFAVLVAVALCPWPGRWTAPVTASARARASWVTVLGAAVAGGLAVVAAANGRNWLPASMDGLDTSGLARFSSPVLVPVAAVGTCVAVAGAVRLRGPIRWAALAAAAAFGDVLLAVFSLHTFSVGWYAGRSLSAIACAVVAVAMLDEFGRLKHRLAVEADRLRTVLARTEELELLHSTLLNHMTDGVLLQSADGELVAMNPAAEGLLGLDSQQFRDNPPAGWQLLHPDGRSRPFSEAPSMVTLQTGVAQRDEMVGVDRSDGTRRWLRVNTSAERATPDGPIRYIMSSMTDETRRHEDYQAGRRERDEKRERVQAVLDEGGPKIVVQPIVDLRSGIAVGGEALSRFAGPLIQGPDRWFADAADVGLGSELEMLAVRGALRELSLMPPSTYLSVNVSAATAVGGELLELLRSDGVPSDRMVVELTEHTDVASYPLLHIALASMRALGVKVAVDDTGSGFASLSHILNLRPDIVKLDIELVRGIHLDPARRALATGLLAFAEQIGAYLVAEGIETEYELAALRDIGVTHGQGYYLARPAPLPWPLQSRAYGELAVVPAVLTKQ